MTSLNEGPFDRGHLHFAVLQETFDQDEHLVGELVQPFHHHDMRSSVGRRDAFLSPSPHDS